MITYLKGLFLLFEYQAQPFPLMYPCQNGAHCEGLFHIREMVLLSMELHINILELQAVHFTFAEILQGKKGLFRQTTQHPCSLLTNGKGQE